VFSRKAFGSDFGQGTVDTNRPLGGRGSRENLTTQQCELGEMVKSYKNTDSTMSVDLQLPSIRPGPRKGQGGCDKKSPSL
jgi:hypothetical protein